jgi:DNA-binding SARP family transcriptional activator
MTTNRGSHALAASASVSSGVSGPLRESLHELVIRTHLAQGNRAEAIRHHRGHLAPVESQLGLRPDPELLRLLRAAG